MKILHVSQISYQNNNVNFEAKKKDESSSMTMPSSLKNSGLKKAVPTAALVLAMIGSPAPANRVDAAPLNNSMTEMQWYPHHPHYHIPPFIPCPPPPPVIYYYNPYAYDFVLPTLLMVQYMQSVAALTNVYTAPVTPVSVGGVAFNKQDIKSVGAYEHDDVVYHNVVLKNGTSVSFPEQDEDNYPAIYRDNNGYKFEGLYGALVQGSDNRDRYTLNGCKNTLVDVGGDDRIDRVLVQRYRVLPDGSRQYTEDVSVTAGKNDIVNNRRVTIEDETSTYSGYNN